MSSALVLRSVLDSLRGRPVATPPLLTHELFGSDDAS